MSKMCHQVRSNAEIQKDQIHSGFTLVEILVVVVVISILLALLLAGVQYARESARRTQCSNNLRQIGLAIASYESVYRCFPQAQNSNGSFLTAILPFSEQSNLYREISAFIADGQEITSFQHSLPGYICPSDSSPLNQTEAFHTAGANYCGNSGSWTVTAKSYDGIFRYMEDIGFGAGVVRISDVTDGVTNTSCVSEWLRADCTFDRMRVNWNMPDSYPNNRTKFASDCRAIPSSAYSVGWRGSKFRKGSPWIDGNITVTLYNHVCTPNSPSCYNRSALPTAAASVAGNHSGAVNVAFADGRVESLDQMVDSEIWFSFGSRNGNEVGFVR